MGVAIKLLTILGSTGSIGENALRVVSRYPERFSLVGLSAYSKAERLIEQALEFRPRAVCFAGNAGYQQVKEALHEENITVYGGRDGLLELAARDDCSLLLNAIVGAPGMEPTVAAIRAGVDIALSNKESLVMAGAVINNLLAEHQVNLYPVDSEHSAIWQCLTGEDPAQVRKLIITGSGGPFRTVPKEQFETLSVEEALNHPNWNMGNKITIDSATMANKGLEVIEAHWLFGLDVDRIQVLIHPQSIIHSLVEFRDGSVKAQLGVPDMKVPIQYALMYPEHAEADWETLDLAAIGRLTFEAPDFEKFRCMALAFEALQAGGTMPAVLNVANESAVYAFLDEQIGFHEIPRWIEAAMEAHQVISEPSLDDILDTEKWTKKFLEPKLKTIDE